MNSTEANKLLHDQKFLAFAAGEQMQWYAGDSGWTDDTAFEPLHFLRYGDKIRVKKEPVPPGDLTWEEAKKLHEEGVKVEFYNVNEWQYCNCWFWSASIEYQKQFAYRRKPEPVKVPLKPANYIGAWLTHNMTDFWNVTSIIDYRIYTTYRGMYQRHTPESLIGWKRSYDHGRTWLPCHTEE